MPALSLEVTAIASAGRSSAHTQKEIEGVRAGQTDRAVSADMTVFIFMSL